MEVVIPVQDMDFDFNSARSSPYPTAPSSPRRFGGYYSSAPSSPSRLSEFYREFDDFLEISSNNNIKADYNKHEDDFAFDVGYEVNAASVSAEELFDGGMIKPLKPQPRSQHGDSSAERSPSSLRSPRSPISHGKKMIMGAFSPKHKKESDPFASAAQKGSKLAPERERGRERAPAGLSSSSRRAARSLSPLRVSQYPWEEEQELLQNQKQPSMEAKSSSSSSSSSALTSSSSKGRKWRLKDFFLFRSASEGRASDKDPLKKYTALFRRIDSPSAVSSTRRKGPVSAHELHYTANRAAKEELKKKTFLPYKQGILGRLAINPGVHALANGFPFHK